MNVRVDATDSVLRCQSILGHSIFMFIDFACHVRVDREGFDGILREEALRWL